MEQYWKEARQKELAEKRRDEEAQETIKLWQHTRGRMEGEIQRKKEHLNFATDFQKARGFVRTNWSTKNFNPEDNPLEMTSSSEEEDDDILKK